MRERDKRKEGKNKKRMREKDNKKQ